MTDTAVAQLPQRLGQAVPLGLLNLRLSSRVGRTALASPEAVTQGLATAKVFAFASADYPGAALSMLFDSNGTTAVGAFEFDSTSALVTAFTFTGGAYEILSVPGSIASYATGINSAGLIVGTYEALGPPVRGFVKNGSTFSDVVFPGATATQAADLHYTLTDLGVAPAGSWHGPLGVGPLKMGINKHGDVAASRAISLPGIPAPASIISQAFLERNGGLRYDGYFEVWRRYWRKPHDETVHPFAKRPA